METTHQPTELEQAEAILEAARSALSAECDLSAPRPTNPPTGEREAELTLRDADLVRREQRLEEARIQQQELAAGLEEKTAELRRQLAELERRQADLMAQTKAAAEPPQIESLAARLIAEVDREKESAAACLPLPEALTERRRPGTPIVSTPAADAFSDDEDEVPETIVTRRPRPVVTEPVDEEEEEQPTPAVGRPGRAQRASDDDQSIEQYMAALLNRMRGGSDADVIAVPQPKPVKTEEAPPLVTEANPPQAPVEPQTAAEQCVIEVRPAPAEMQRRVKPAADLSGLAAMRELANCHARIAIDLHGKKELVKTVLGAWAGGIAGAGGSLVAFCVVPAEETMLRIGCLMICVGSSYWVFKAVRATQKLFATRPSFEAPSQPGKAEARETTPAPAASAQVAAEPDSQERSPADAASV